MRADEIRADTPIELLDGNKGHAVCISGNNVEVQVPREKYEAGMAYEVHTSSRISPYTTRYRDAISVH